MDHWQDFYFLRHGQTDWNLEIRFQGHSDIPLNATGLEQAADAAQRLKNVAIDCIVSSPLIRALKTASVVAEAKRLPVHIDSRLMERDFGGIDGQHIMDVKRLHGVALEERTERIMPPDAETREQLHGRIQQSVDDWLTRRPGEKLLFVAHDGVYHAIATALLRDDTFSKHGRPYYFSRPDGPSWTVREVGPRD